MRRPSLKRQSGSLGAATLSGPIILDRLGNISCYIALALNSLSSSTYSNTHHPKVLFLISQPPK